MPGRTRGLTAVVRRSSNRRRAVLRGVSAVLAGLVLVGCSGGDEGNGGSSTRSSTYTPRPKATPTVDQAALNAAMADMRARLASAPEQIAADFGRFGNVRTSGAEVQQLAKTLCREGFRGAVTVNWLQSEAPTKSVMLLSPTMRVLELAGTRDICTRPALQAEQAAYRTSVFAFLSPALTTAPALTRAPTLVSTETANTICELLGTEGGGNAATYVLNALAEFGTRGRVDVEEALALSVEVAGHTCEHWLPVANQALAQYFRTPAGG